MRNFEPIILAIWSHCGGVYVSVSVLYADGLDEGIWAIVTKVKAISMGVGVFEHCWWLKYSSYIICWDSKRKFIYLIGR